jgi:hypothetical protein
MTRARPRGVHGDPAFLERELDAAATERPNAGDVPLFRRLTRTEYENSIRDLLALDHLPAELDYELLLPADNASSGFDNIADLLFVSPVVMERYIGAAQKLARIAVGDMRTPVLVNIYKLSEQLPQDERVEGLSFGTRGGLATEMYFSARRRLHGRRRDGIGHARGARDRDGIDGARAAVQKIGVATPVPRRGADRVSFRVPVPAGPHLFGVTFVERSEALDENLVRSRMRSRGTLPAMAIATIRGPYSPTGPGDTPSRRRIFTCRPNAADTEMPCARQILTTLAWHAYRRWPRADLADLMPFYEQGRADGGFEPASSRARAIAGEPAIPTASMSLPRLRQDRGDWAADAPRSAPRAEQVRRPRAAGCRSESPVSDSSLRRACRSFSGAASPTTSCLPPPKVARCASPPCSRRRCSACWPTPARKPWSRTSPRSGSSCATSQSRTPTSFCSPITTPRCARRSSARRSCSSTACFAAAAACSSS